MRDDTDDIARMLEAAAADAPRSPRQELLRAALLDSVASRRSNPFLAPLAVAAVVLLGVLLAVGAPAEGSMISDILDRSGPAPARPGPTDPAPPSGPEDTLEAPRIPPSADAAVPSPPSGVGDGAPPADLPPVTTPAPAVPGGAGEPEPVEQVQSAAPGPPIPVPTPPVITPPPTGPPPGVPAP